MSSSCCWCKSRELGGRGSLKFPCITPTVESFSSDVHRAIISYWARQHLESCQTPCQMFQNLTQTLLLQSLSVYSVIETKNGTCFELRTSSVNMTESTVSCGFSHIY